MSEYLNDQMPDDEIARQAALYAPFTDSIRTLVDAAIRTEAPEDVIRQAQEEIDAITRRLRQQEIDGSFGIRFGESGRVRNWGNAVVGLRNALAPPLHILDDGAGRAWADFDLGAAYEGPAGLVHGGVVALILDHLLGHAANSGGSPGMTAGLTLRYLRGTPLGPLSAEAHIERVDGRKTYVVGAISDHEGITVEAEGVFIMPRWMGAAHEARDPEELAG